MRRLFKAVVASTLLVMMLPNASVGANPAEWTETTDVDFGAGILTDVDVVGVGDAAQLELALADYDWFQHFPATSPTPRMSFNAYDRVNEKTVLFGGFDFDGSSQAYRADTWLYDVAAETWEQQFPATSPGARDRHTMAFDTYHGQVVVFGGYPWNNQLWAYDVAANTWQQRIADNPPPVKAGHGMTYDSTRHLLIFFGGYTGSWSNATNDTWVYDVVANTWEQRFPSVSPPARVYHMGGMVYDEANDKVVLFGGNSAGWGIYGDTWLYDVATNTWEQQFPATSPPGRTLHGMTYDSSKERVLLFGGWRSGDLNDTWSYDVATNTWEQHFPVSQPPARYTGLTYDTASQSAVLFGNEYDDQTWVYSPQSYQLSGTRTSPVHDAGFVADWGTISWMSSEPSGTSVTIETRSSDDGVDWSPWQAQVNGGDTLSPSATYVQYRATLASSDGSTSPALHDVTISYAPANAPPEADAGGPYVATEGSTFELDASASTDPDGDPLGYAWDLDDDGEYDDATGVVAPHAFGDNGLYPVGVQVTDTAGSSDTDHTTVAVSNVAPTVDYPTLPSEPVAMSDQPIVAEAAFSDPGGVLDEPYTCAVDYGDGAGGQIGTIVGTSCVGPDQSYAEPGVYAVSVTVTDKDGDSGSATAADFVVVYDPTGGFVTGGGWIDSPPGADPADPELTGKATFGFVSKYKKGATAPTGNTEFQFKAGDLNFRSASYDWLVIAGQDKAKYKGAGTINGAGDYGFMLTAVDNGFSGDTFRIKIWDRDAADAVVYDNQIDADDADFAGTAINGGNIKVHQP